MNAAGTGFERKGFGMSPFFKAAASAVVPLLVCIGCLGLAPTPAPPTIDYILEYPPPDANPAPRLPIRLLMEPFDTAAPYRSTAIVLRPGPFQRQGYVYHRWRNEPGPLVSSLLMRDLVQGGLFSAVFSSGSRLKATHVMEGLVEAFYAQKGEDGRLRAVLVLTVTLVALEAPGEEADAWQRRFKAEQVCAQESPRGIAAGFSSALQAVSRDLAAALETHLRYPTKP